MLLGLIIFLMEAMEENQVGLIMENIFLLQISLLFMAMIYFPLHGILIGIYLILQVFRTIQTGVKHFTRLGVLHLVT